MNRLCIGLTGGIGSGKSTVARLFGKLGADVIDADEIAHDLTQPGGAAMAAIALAFGSDYVTDNGALNRTRMRELIFSDADAKLRLEALLHPMILQACIERLRAESLAPYAMLMAPLLLENPEFSKLAQRVLLVDCTEQSQISRVMLRSAMDEGQIRAIIAAQMPSAERRARADDVIDNDGAQDRLSDQVFALHNRYLDIAKQTPFDGNLTFNISSGLDFHFNRRQ